MKVKVKTDMRANKYDTGLHATCYVLLYKFDIYDYVPVRFGSATARLRRDI